MRAETPKDIAELDWKKAPGITERGKRGTNSMLEERDYTVNCDTTGNPLMVVHGVHIWFCKSHHQPHFLCESAKARALVKDFAESVKKADKTSYEYGGYESAKNNEGDKPPMGSRWLTPKELAFYFLKKLTN